MISNKKDIKIIITRKLPDIIETRLKELFTVQCNYDDTPFNHEQLLDAMMNCDILVPCITDKIDRTMLEQSRHNLKMIASFTNGIDHIDIRAAHEFNITVTNTPDALTEDVADMAMTMICSISRRVLEGEHILREGNWQGWSPSFMLGSRVWSKKLGIIGMGRIGTALARRAQGFGMEIHYHNRNQVAHDTEQKLNATYWENLDAMINHVDIVSLHCPNTPATYHILNKRRIELLQPSSFVINTARGEIIDEKELIKALYSGRIAGAALDVFEQAPFINPQFFRLSNVLLLPHMASNTLEGRIQMGERVLINIYNFTDDHPPPDRILGISV